MKKTEATTIHVKSCQRCGKDHEIDFNSLANAVDEYNFWGECTNTGQPVLMKITPDDAPPKPNPVDDMMTLGEDAKKTASSKLDWSEHVAFATGDLCLRKVALDPERKGGTLTTFSGDKFNIGSYIIIRDPDLENLKHAINKTFGKGTWK